MVEDDEELHVCTACFCGFFYSGFRCDDRPVDIQSLAQISEKGSLLGLLILQCCSPTNGTCHFLLPSVTVSLCIILGKLLHFCMLFVFSGLFLGGCLLVL